MLRTELRDCQAAGGSDEGKEEEEEGGEDTLGLCSSRKGVLSKTKAGEDDDGTGDDGDDDSPKDALIELPLPPRRSLGRNAPTTNGAASTASVILHKDCEQF